MSLINPNLPNPAASQFTSNAAQSGALASNVNRKLLDQSKMQDEDPQAREHSFLSPQARQALQQQETDAAKHMENAQHSGASGDIDDAMTHDEGELGEARERDRQAELEKAGKKGQMVPTGGTAGLQAGHTGDHGPMDDEQVSLEVDRVLNRTPDEILGQDMPDHAKLAATNMVRTQPVDKLAELKPLPEREAGETATPELQSVPALGPQVEDPAPPPVEALPMQASTEEQQVWAEQAKGASQAGSPHALESAEARMQAAREGLREFGFEGAFGMLQGKTDMTVQALRGQGYEADPKAVEATWSRETAFKVLTASDVGQQLNSQAERLAAQDPSMDKFGHFSRIARDKLSDMASRGQFSEADVRCNTALLDWMDSSHDYVKANDGLLMNPAARSGQVQQNLTPEQTADKLWDKMQKAPPEVQGHLKGVVGSYFENFQAQNGREPNDRETADMINHAVGYGSLSQLHQLAPRLHEPGVKAQVESYADMWKTAEPAIRKKARGEEAEELQAQAQGN